MKCDDCGRFFSPHKPGWSWLFVPGVQPLSYEEVRERCQDCTARLGALRSRQNVRHELVSGVYAARRGEGGGNGLE